jgi:hypothetical protein
LFSAVVYDIHGLSRKQIWNKSAVHIYLQIKTYQWNIIKNKVPHFIYILANISNRQQIQLDKQQHYYSI